MSPEHVSLAAIIAKWREAARACVAVAHMTGGVSFPPTFFHVGSGEILDAIASQAGTTPRLVARDDDSGRSMVFVDVEIDGQRIMFQGPDTIGFVQGRAA